MITHNMIQGSKEWHAHRAAHFNASDAPAMLGISPYKTRTQLLTELKTGITPEVDQFTQSRFNAGHASEALARPIAEKIIGEELSPVVGTEGDLSASFDGITFIGDVAFEHKLLARRLEEVVWVSDNAEDFLPEDYLVQMEQQLHVSGAEKCLFMASKWNDEGELIEERHCWYYPNMERRQRIIDGWAQFDKDLAAYVPPEAKAAPETKPAESLPVPSIMVKGEVTLSNLAEILPEFDRVLESTNTELVTDDHFAQADIDAKASRTAAKNLKLTAQAVIDQIAPVSEVVRTLENYASKFDALGLKLEKAVKSQKDLIKTSAIMKAKQDLDAHVAELESEIKPIRMSLPPVDFAGAISGVKTIASMQERINNALLTAKMDADAMARDIRAKLAWCKEHAEGFGMLFPDLQQIIGKAMDDFQLVIKSRIDEHKRAEAEKEARIKAEAEEAARQKIAAEASHPAAQQSVDSAPAIQTNAAPQVGMTRPATTPSARIKLGDINAALGFMVTADFLASIGWEPVAKERNSIMYREVDFQAICESLVEHIVAVAGSYDFKKAA